MMSTPHYSNARLIDASGYQVFGENLANPIASTAGYAHNLTTWPGTVWDFSGVPLCRSQASVLPTTWTGALITPRHVLTAHHVAPDFTVGDDIHFVDLAGTLVTREITAKSSNLGNDCCLLTLDSAATGCKVYALPTVESLSAIVGFTMLTMDRQRRCITRTISTVGTSITHVVDSTGSTLTDVSSGSGQPAFITRGTELVLLGTHHFATSFPSAVHQLAALQAFCDTTSQTITTVSVDPADWAEPLAAQLQDATA